MKSGANSICIVIVNRMSHDLKNDSATAVRRSQDASDGALQSLDVREAKGSDRDITIHGRECLSPRVRGVWVCASVELGPLFTA